MVEKYSLKIEEDTYDILLQLRELHNEYLDLLYSNKPFKPCFLNEKQELDYLLFVSLLDELNCLEDRIEKLREVKSSE